MKSSKRKRSNASGGAPVDLRSLAEIVEQFTSKTIVLFGDFVADIFEFGEISRVSREAPVLILKQRETQLVPGGGANATNNFVELGAKVLPVTVVGDDPSGVSLVEYFKAKRVNVSGIGRVKGWRTPTKTRYLAGWAHTVGQQVLRVDREPNTAIPAEVQKKLRRSLLTAVKRADALAVSDYGFGAASPGLVAEAAAKAKKSIPITLDARHNLHAHARSRVTAATPNESELEAQHHIAVGDNFAELIRAGRGTLETMKLSSLLVTRGRHGLVLFERGNGFVNIPVHGSDQAVDVTGAGDTVLAAYTLALASGASALEAAHIANIAGGLVVMKRGTATVSRKELLAAIQREVAGLA